MKIALSSKHDAYYNLALEEVLLKHEVNDDILLIYINENSVIFGRNQNILEEVNLDFVQAHNIQLVRRISGGGAVYQDQGNINFSFITKNKQDSYQKFLAPIIDFLKSLGLKAEFKGKNDLVVNGFKVSGNAQYRLRDRMFHHGTLLFNSDLSVLGQALKPNQLKLASKAIKSARQRVSNIYDLLPVKMSAQEFTDKLITYFAQEQGNEMLPVTNYRLSEVLALASERQTKAWIWGKNPQFDIHNEQRFEGGTISFAANVTNNKIQDLVFTGDFLSSNNFEQVYQYLQGVEFAYEPLKQALSNLRHFDHYFGKLTPKNLLTLMLKD